MHRYFALLTSFFILFSCAAIQAPSGGPIDNIPPELIEAVPPSGTVNFGGGDVCLRFSEYLDESTFEKGVQVFPRSYGESILRFLGDEVCVNMTKKLLEDQTYVITIGRELKDEHGVRLAEPVHLAYGTGGEISQGQISGRIYDEENISIHLWKTKEEAMDSIFFSRPDYVTGVTDEGYYRFEFLSPGRYQILAIGSEGTGYQLDPRRMRYGLYWENHLEIGDSDTLEGINMFIQKEDEPFHLLDGEWTSGVWGRLFFNRKLPTGELKGRMTILTEDSLSMKADFFRDPFNDRALIVTVLDSIQGSIIDVQLTYLSENGQTLLDSSSLKIRVSADQDTSWLELTYPQDRLAIQPESKNIPPISLIFSKPFQIDSVFQSMKLFKEDSIEVETIISIMSPMEINLELVEGWNPNQSYLLQFVKNINYGKMTLEDSLTNIHLETKDFVGYGNFSGTVARSDAYNLNVEIKSIKSEDVKYTAIVNSDQCFEFRMIKEGKYRMIIFDDNNHDGEYTFGRASPYNTPEQFTVIPDTLEIRSNWDLEIKGISQGGLR